MLKRKISRDGRVAQLSTHAALLYVLSIPHLDIDGRMDGSPVAVRGTIVPALADPLTSAHATEWTDSKIAAYIAEWTATTDEDSGRPRPLVLHYCVGGIWTCQFQGFRENQTLKRDRERPSSFPPPPAMLLADEDLSDADSGAAPEDLRTQAEVEVEVQDQDLPDQREVSRAREADRAALPEFESGETPDDLSAEILEAVARRRAGVDTHGALARLLEVLSDADDQTPAVLHSVFDRLGPAAIEHARREVLEMAPRRPSAYALRIGQRLAGAERSS